jgi:hypothetical protein
MDGFVKVNWEAAVENTKKKMSIGVIIRDSKGEVLATLYEPNDHIIAGCKGNGSFKGCKL